MQCLAVGWDVPAGRSEPAMAGCRRLLWAGDRHDREGKRRLPRCDEGRDLATEKIKTAKKRVWGHNFDILEVTPSVLHSEAYWLGKRFVNSPAPKPLGASGASAHVLYSHA